MMTGMPGLPSERIGFLRGLPLLADVSDASLLALARASWWQRLPQRQILFLQGDGGQNAYLVRSGAIAIVLAGPGGRELVINEMRPGDCFGEMALLTGLSRSSTAMARLASEVLVIPQEAFRALLAGDPRWCGVCWR